MKKPEEDTSEIKGKGYNLFLNISEMHFHNSPMNLYDYDILVWKNRLTEMRSLIFR